MGRIIPACAGKRLIGNRARERAQDHPRMCGEKQGDVNEKALLKGSSPHVRGKGI